MMRINFVLVDQYLYILIDQNVSLSTYTSKPTLIQYGKGNMIMGAQRHL